MSWPHSKYNTFNFDCCIIEFPSAVRLLLVRICFIESMVCSKKPALVTYEYSKTYAKRDWQYFRLVAIPHVNLKTRLLLANTLYQRISCCHNSMLFHHLCFPVKRRPNHLRCSFYFYNFIFRFAQLITLLTLCIFCRWPSSYFFKRKLMSPLSKWELAALLTVQTS